MLPARAIFLFLKGKKKKSGQDTEIDGAILPQQRTPSKYSLFDGAWKVLEL
jgi:hypothetical protein